MVSPLHSLHKDEKIIIVLPNFDYKAMNYFLAERKRGTRAAIYNLWPVEINGLPALRLSDHRGSSQLFQSASYMER